MSVLLIMLPIALVLAGIGVWAFIAAARSGQFDDLDTPALRAVFDDDETPKPRTETRGDPDPQNEERRDP